MPRTTAEWQAMLDRATEGPWYPYDDDWDDKPLVVNDEGRELGWGDQLRVSLESGDITHDRALIAAAPEAVAEILRLRLELEELHKKFVEGADMHAPGRTLEDPIVANIYQLLEAELRRILEQGENHV